MRYRELIRQGQERLEQYPIENPRLEAELLLLNVIGKDRFWLHQLSRTAELSDSKWISIYRKHIRRRCRGEPNAYIAGFKEFYNLFFQVNKHTLIPRPETEELVDYAIRLLPQKRQKETHVLDICCGSGCIGLSVLCERPYIHLDMSDVSAKALQVCRANAKRLLSAPSQPSDFREQKYSYRIYRSYLFRHLSAQRYDLILANPPYITPEEYIELDRTVRCFEPRKALLCSKPYRFYYQLLEGITTRLKKTGQALIEANPSLIEMYKALATAHHLHLEFLEDLSLKPRFLRLSSSRL